jgi:MinD superfamily P-loop ATPase
MNTRTMWVDVARCTGCGVCKTVCPVGAIALTDGKAYIDEELCTGCEACMNVCAENAVHPVAQGELVPASRQPVPIVRQPSPLADATGTIVVATGVGLLAKVTRALARAVGRWLARPSTRSEPSAAEVRSAAAGKGSVGGGRRARHRRRGQ